MVDGFWGRHGSLGRATSFGLSLPSTPLPQRHSGHPAGVALCGGTQRTLPSSPSKVCGVYGWRLSSAFDAAGRLAAGLIVGRRRVSSLPEAGSADIGAGRRAAADGFGRTLRWTV